MASGESPAYWRRSPPYHTQHLAINTAISTRPRTASSASQTSSSASSRSSRSSKELPALPITPTTPMPSPEVSVFEDDSDDENVIRRKLGRRLRRAPSSFLKPENRFGFGNVGRSNSGRDSSPQTFIMYTNGEEIHFVPQSPVSPQPSDKKESGHARKWSWGLPKPKSRSEVTSPVSPNPRSDYYDGNQMHRRMEAVHRSHGF